jgi:DNA-binding response OmpR family regulator
MENAGEMVSRDAIIMHLWESESFIDDNTLTVNIARIRKKLNDIGAMDYIITKKGIGYLV